MSETMFQKQDRQRRERIGIALQKVNEAETPKDLALWVTHDGMDLFHNMMKGMFKQIAQEVFMENMREMMTTALEAQLDQVVNQAIEFELTGIDTKGSIGKIEHEQAVELPIQDEQEVEMELEDKPKPKKSWKPWTPEEDALVVQIILNCDKAMDGVRQASDLLEGRTTSSISYRWYSILQHQVAQHTPVQ